MSAMAISFNQPVQLRCLTNNKVVVSFEKGLQDRPTFSEDYKHLEKAMEIVGIVIPLYDHDKYIDTKSNRAAVYLDDKNFGKAFYGVYFIDKMNPEKFVWEKING